MSRHDVNLTVASLLTTTAILLSVGFGVAPAHASGVADSQTATSYAPECLAAVASARAADRGVTVSAELCRVTRGVAVGTAAPVTDRDIAADAALSVAQKTQILAQSRISGITARHWSQFTAGGVYNVTQNGTFYYNGTRVWVTVAYAGFTGSHACFTNYAAGVSISHTSCSESGGTASRTLYDGWSVSALIKGGPISYGNSMTAVVRSNGTITGFGSTVG
ncbi:hypothetical protein JF66_11885 [Cryobacterium sp. MLB-32]|uniref:hypothetical protein n=1 Tax=Cryobacterium sp. MLB-32 TaxID=1529318 RepID=UPI0004E769AF|nr:hypothetical protein [Cryobacterium sp. MLB-32]KFF59353.1 hypothetical protein JF66_11885 [Cryobacterium sp. MLB-32]